MANHIPPTEVQYIERESRLVIRFEDGLERSLGCDGLRGFCPCARCQGHGQGPPRYAPPSDDRAQTIEDVYPVGNYALCIRWADGHDTGIYSFDLLRRWPDDGALQSVSEGDRLSLEPSGSRPT